MTRRRGSHVLQNWDGFRFRAKRASALLHCGESVASGSVPRQRPAPTMPDNSTFTVGHSQSQAETVRTDAGGLSLTSCSSVVLRKF